MRLCNQQLVDKLKQHGFIKAMSPVGFEWRLYCSIQQ